MKKTFLMAVAALAISMSAHAIRAVHKLFPQKQSDGTTVMLYTNGDGRLAFYTTEDHQVVIRDSKGTLCYAALKDGVLVPTDVVVHNLAERTAKEKAFVASNTLKPTDEALKPLLAPMPHHIGEKKNISRTIASSTVDVLGEYGLSSLGAIPSVGKITIPVIMVEYSDVKFQPTSTTEKYSRFMNDEGYHEDDETQVGSVRDYYLSQSRGMFDPTFEIVAKVTLDKPTSYYGGHSGSSKDVRSTLLFKDAVKAAVNSGVDFSKYEVKNTIPNVIIFYAGYGEATGGGDDTIWPHERDLGYPYGVVGDYIFDSYFMGNELYGGTGTKMMGMGVMTHELTHALGFPDIYDTQYTFENEDAPMGSWSVMDNGAYCPNGYAYAPMGYNAYERSYMGWLKIRELKDAENVKLGDPSDPESEFAVMYRNPSDVKEYFILENRVPGTWYNAKYGTGLLVSRIAYDRSKWTSNTANIIQDKKRAMVVTASGRKLVGDGVETDLFGNGVNNKDDFKFFSGEISPELAIYKVLKNPDGILTFNFKDKSMPTTHAVSNNGVYEKVTDVNTLAANDYVIFVNEADGVAASVNAQSGSRGAVAVKIENGSVVGNDFVMPFKLLKNNNGSFAFASSSNSYLSASATGLKLVKKADANCLADISITDGNASITFTGTAKRNKLSYSYDDTNFSSFADAKDQIQIYRKSGELGINGVTTTGVKKDGRVFNLAGQQVGDDYKGIVIVNGKKIVRK